MKKMLTIFMIVAALVVCMIPFVSAENDPALTVTPSVTEAKPGDKITVDIAIVNNVEIGVISSNIEMSAPGLTWTKIAKAGFKDITSNKATGRVVFSGNKIDNEETGETEVHGFIGDGVLFSITYEIPADAAAGDYTITATTYDSGIRANDKDGTTVIAGNKAFSATVHVCVDSESDTDHFCDDPNCGKTLSDCANADTDDHECDICGKAVTFCKDSLTAYAANEASCTAAGNSAYWECTVCGKFYDSADAANEIAENSWVLPSGHNMTEHAAVAPTCTTDGNVKYFACSGCNKNYDDAAGTHEIANVVLKATHTAGYSLSEWYDLTGTLNTQGVAISGDYVFQADKYGHVFMFNLGSATPTTIVAEFNLGSYNNGVIPDGYDYPAKGKWANHSNTMMFGATKFDESDPFPLLYVSTGNGGEMDSKGSYVVKCAVERILQKPDGTWYAELVQMIEINDFANIPVETDKDGNAINPYKNSNCDTNGNSTLLNMWDAETGTFPYVSGNGYDASKGYEKMGWGWFAFLVDCNPTETTENKFYVKSARFRTTEAYEIYNKALYGISSYYEDNAYIITEFDLPALPASTSAEDGYGATVTLQPKDITDQIVTEYNMHFTQGGTMNKGRLYYSYGNKGTTDWNHNGIQIFDIAERRLVGTYKLCNSVTEEATGVRMEPECVAFWGDTLILSGRNTTAVLYKFDAIVTKEVAVEATCTEDGVLAHYHCSGCGKNYSDAACTIELESIVDSADGHQYFYECDAHCMNCGELTNPNAAHKIKHVEAVEAKCDAPGNIEYWTCEYCNGCWDNENAAGMPLNMMSVKTFKDHEYVYACDAHCMNCGELTNEDAAHKIKHVEAVEATCEVPGNIEYWTCEYCNGCWDNENATGMPLNMMSVKTFAEHEYLFECDAHCKNCGELTNEDAAHKIIHVEAKDPTCFEYGNIEYWTCEYCNGCWDNENATGMPLNAMSVRLQPKHTAVVHMEAVAPGCHYIGNIEYWVCYDCEGVWQDEDLTQVTNIKNVILPALESTATHVAAKDPTCYENGNKEYWYCDECEQVWENEALTALSNIKNVQIAPKHTNLVHMEAVAPGCHYIGNIEYWVCYDCEGVWQDEALTQVTNIKNVILPALESTATHVEAKAPTCEENGNKEYWYCDKCEQVWENEALTALSNIKNVQIAATGHTLIEVDYVAPTATEDGNINYWYCEVCEKYFADAEGTEEITYEETIIPANPETGDSTMLVPAAILALLGITGTAVLVSKKNLLK